MTQYVIPSVNVLEAVISVQ